MSLSGEGKVILDQLTEILDLERPSIVKICLAKGIAESNGIPDDLQKLSSKNKWTIPDGIIKEKEFSMFKHLIINEINTSITNVELHKYMLIFIEKGLRLLKNIHKEKASLEDIRISIL